MRECYVEKFNLQNPSSSDDDVQRILASGDSDALIEFQNFLNVFVQFYNR